MQSVVGDYQRHPLYTSIDPVSGAIRQTRTTEALDFAPTEAIARFDLGGDRQAMASKMAGYEHDIPTGKSYASTRVRSTVHKSLQPTMYSMAKLRAMGQYDPRAQLALAAIDEKAINAIQVVQLRDHLAGITQQWYHLLNACTNVMANQLEIRIPYLNPDWQVQDQVGPETRPIDQRSGFQDIAVELPKDRIRVTNPVENIMKATLNPQYHSEVQAGTKMMRNKNINVLKALELLDASPTTINAPEDILSSGRSEHNPLGDIAEQLETNALGSDIPYTKIVCHPEIVRAINQNDTSNNGGDVGRKTTIMPYGGVTDLPGLEGMTVISDLMCPRRSMYVLSDEALYACQGPKQINKYYDNDLMTNITDIVDWYKIVAATPNLTTTRKYAFKLVFRAKTAPSR